MTEDDDLEALDRHALALTIWLTAAVAAAALYHFGAASGGSPFIIAAFLVVASAFAGHVTVNVVLGRGFSAGELALGLVLYGGALITFGIATLASPGFAARAFVPTSLGFVGLFATFMFYMVVKSGARLTFESFDVIRRFGPRDEPNDGKGRQ